MSDLSLRCQMTIRIVHTADNHIDLLFKNYPDDVANFLKEERMAALTRIVDVASEKKANFIVVAGDLFESVKSSLRVIKRTVDILARFTGNHVLVLPGNHDFFSDQSSELWVRFREAAGDRPIKVLTESQIENFNIDDQQIQFFACPCRSKTSKDHAIGWVVDEPRIKGAINIGVAHGNVDDLGLDNDDKFFNMSRNDLRAAKMHAWLLGHIHRPFPNQDGTDSPDLFMAGSHSPHSVRNCHSGSAWFIELNKDGIQRYETIHSSDITFKRIEHIFCPEKGLDNLKSQVSALVPQKTVLDLKLQGTLKNEDFNDLALFLKKIEIEGCFINVRINRTDVMQELSLAQIEQRFSGNSFAHKLMLDLLRSGNPNDAKVALKIIEGLR